MLPQEVLAGMAEAVRGRPEELLMEPHTPVSGAQRVLSPGPVTPANAVPVAVESLAPPASPLPAVALAAEAPAAVLVVGGSEAMAAEAGADAVKSVYSP